MPTLWKDINRYLAMSCTSETKGTEKGFGDLPNANRGFNRTIKVLMRTERIAGGHDDAVPPPTLLPLRGGV